MRIPEGIMALLVVAGGALGGCANPSVTVTAGGKTISQEKVIRGFVPGTKITLKPRKDKYFLGENILLDYRISYDGDGALDVRWISGLRTVYSSVIATDQAGNRVPESTLKFDCTGGGGTSLRRGASIALTIPLMRYCRFEKPGTYRVRVAYNLGWSKGDYGTWAQPAVPQDDPRWAETTILLAMPDAVQAREIVESMRRLRSDVGCYRHLSGFYQMSDFADFVCLQYPVYLPILEELAAGKDGDTKALIGIAHIPTPEATDLLIRLLKHPNREFALKVAGALYDRLPEPQATPGRERKNPIEAEDADPQLVKQAWRNDFAPPVREFACKMLNEKEPMSLQCAAFALEAIGTADDIPSLIAALDKIIPVVERTRPEMSIGKISPSRKACMDLVCAVEALAGRGVEPTVDPQTPGEIIHFVLAVKQRKDFRPAGWEKRCADWVRAGTPYVREVVLFNAPQPLPETLLEQYQTGVRKVIATTKEWTDIGPTVQVALNLKIPVDEILGMLVDRLDSPELYPYLLTCLRDLLETGKHEHLYDACPPHHSQEEIATAKAAWKRFLQEHRQAIREGRHFDRDTPEILRMLSP